MKFQDLLAKSRKSDSTWQPPEKLLALDPGETIGWAVFEQGKFLECGQKESKNHPAKSIQELFQDVQPTMVVAEDYKVYAHKSDAHKWNDLFTPRLLGMIELLSDQYKIPLHLQMAGTVKQFCNAHKLMEWGFYKPGKRHADDAIKHATYFLLFHNRRIQDVREGAKKTDQ